MKRPAVLILIGASGILIAGATSLHTTVQSHPFAAVSWLAAILAFGVFAVMLLQHSIYERQTHLFLGAAFLAMGVTGIRESRIFPPNINIPGPDNGYFALWQLGWITLAVLLVWGLMVDKSPVHDQQRPYTVVLVTGGVVVWSAFVILLTSVFPAATYLVLGGKPGMVINILCCGVFVVSAFMYSRPSVHKSNSVLLWMAYGLVFAALAQLAVVLDFKWIHNTQFGIANLLKALSFLTPLAGMLVENSRLQLRLHEQSTDFNHLIQMQQAVISISSTTELYQRIVELVSFSFSAGAVCLMPVDKERSLIYAAGLIGIDDEVSKRLIFRPGEGKAGDCLSRQEVIFARDVFADPVMAQKLYGVTGIGSAVFAPLMLKENCLGVLAVFFSGRPMRAQKLPKEQLKMLDALAAQAALALDIHQLRNRIGSAVKATDDHARELEIVSDIGQAVSSQLEMHSLVDTLADRLKEVINARACSILLFDPDIVGVRIMGKKKLARYSSISEHTDTCELIAARVAQSNETEIINNVPNSCHCKYPEMAVDDDGTHHLLSVPMHLPGFYGAINVFRQNAEPFGERERRILTRLAPVIAISIRNAELYERERKIAESLQQSFLPVFDGDLPDIEALSYYLAAYDESLVGGDFYDLIDFGDGKYGIVIGDVAGKGLDAAVYTAMTRYMIKAYSFDNIDPKYVMSKVNYALCKYTPVGKFVTAFYGVVDTKANTLRYANAGHELPFFRKNKDNRLEVLKTTGPAAGALLEAEYSVEQIPFKQG
ncbi:MAG: SpoIIE family protein phosphatase, partial [Armatimonadota bacterium]